MKRTLATINRNRNRNFFEVVIPDSRRKNAISDSIVLRGPNPASQDPAFSKDAADADGDGDQCQKENMNQKQQQQQQQATTSSVIDFKFGIYYGLALVFFITLSTVLVRHGISVSDKISAVTLHVEKSRSVLQLENCMYYADPQGDYHSPEKIRAFNNVGFDGCIEASQYLENRYMYYLHAFMDSYAICNSTESCRAHLAGYREYFLDMLLKASALFVITGMTVNYVLPHLIGFIILNFATSANKKSK